MKEKSIKLETAILTTLKAKYINFPKHTKVVIDKIKYEDCCSNHIMCRVINLYSRPKWLDAGWFEFFS
jgi:hypothetical protein